MSTAGRKSPTRRRRTWFAAAVGAVLVVLLALWGPSFVPPQSDAALNACLSKTGGTEAAIRWQVLPKPGWICKQAGYVGYWN